MSLVKSISKFVGAKKTGMQRQRDHGSTVGKRVTFAKDTKDARVATPRCAACRYPFLSGAGRQARRCGVCKQVVCAVQCMCQITAGDGEAHGRNASDDLCVTCGQIAMSWLLSVTTSKTLGVPDAPKLLGHRAARSIVPGPPR